MGEPSGNASHEAPDYRRLFEATPAPYLILAPDFTIVAVNDASGYGRAENRRKSEEAGFDRHMTKPVDVEELRALIEGLEHCSGDEPASPSQ